MAFIDLIIVIKERSSVDQALFAAELEFPKILVYPGYLRIH